MWKSVILWMTTFLTLTACSTKEEPVYEQPNFNVNSSNAIMIDLTNDKVLYTKNEDEKVYPASLTKMMTVLVAIENMKQDEMMTIADYSQFYADNASMAGFLPNDEVSTMDLIYGTMLPSGADAAASLAVNIAGSEAAFVDLMNKKAKELGMDETHFTNVTGLHHPNHYTTVADLSKLLEYALKDRVFSEVFTTKRYSTDGSLKNPDGITFYSRLFSKLDTPKFKGGEILGGKTGYTPEAGLCLASLATDNKDEYILITTGGPGDGNSEQTNIIDAINLYQHFLGQ